MKKIQRFFLGILLGFMFFSVQVNAAEEAKEKAENTPNIKAEDLYKLQEKEIIIGKPDAPVTMIEYASLSCSHCAAFYNDTFPDLKEQYIDTGKVKLIYRDFPLDEPALRAAMLVRCASPEEQEKFLKVMFRTQSNWVGHKNYLEVLSNIAKLGGMSGEKIEQCLADKDLEKQIMQSRLDAANALSIRATPSFFINGEAQSGARSFDYFKEQLDKALEAAGIAVEPAPKKAETPQGEE